MDNPLWAARGSPITNTASMRGGPKGTVGCPYWDGKIAFFDAMLEAARAIPTEADIASLREWMLAMRRENDAKNAAARAKT